jgi:glutamine amidotransferase
VTDCVAIIDGGGANIASLQFALARLGAKSQLTTNAATIESASHVILPGVGAAAAAMRTIRSRGLDEVIPKLEQPVLGICLGMQLLAAKSEEDDAGCLGIFPDKAEKLVASPSSPVPNMGWCRLLTRKDSRLLSGIRDGSWFYFVHSYALPVNSRTTGTAAHASDFSAVMSSDNFHATQFHPERSSSAGARILKNFLEMR